MSQACYLLIMSARGKQRPVEAIRRAAWRIMDATVVKSLAASSWLGRRGPTALAVLVLIGVFAPALGNLLRPYVGQAVFVLLALAFMQSIPQTCVLSLLDRLLPYWALAGPCW